ncbi:DNA polymerase-3 subunit delta [Salibacterium salarium]|uniref:DNA polymerase III subunit delta n=1 Tax=Salibacterium salarium TaxID=284579 RepID=UPI002789ABAC|nr:DNA polymerase III subunit delta [Salibacterium salarium]MDQ0299771.1 DNA polymerase-3 subunit delta [Salibacterium salarium]
MEYTQLLKELNQHKISSLYLLYGTEEYIIKNVIEKIVSASLAEEERDFNYSIYDMKETPVELPVEEGETLPFFGGKRVILMRNCYFLTGVKDKEKIEHNVSYFEQYVDNAPEETVMIVTVSHEKLDERKKLVKKLKKQGIVLDANPFDEKNMMQWLHTYVHDSNFNMTDDAKQKVIQLAGKDMMMLSSEMEKLSLYIEKDGEINEEIVEKLVARTLEDNVFELVDHVVNGRSEKALRIYYDLMKQNEEPIKILALLARQFRIILHVSHLKKTGYSRQKIASQLKLHPYAVKIAEGQASKYNELMLKNVLKELAEADYKVKTGKFGKSLQLELSIVKLANL